MADENNNSGKLSYAAAELRRLKTATIEAAGKRDRLPQPLFWSLFHSSVKEIRELKEKQRTLAELLDG